MTGSSVVEAGLAEKVRVTEAKAQLSELMARAGYGGERFVIEWCGRLLAALVGVEGLDRLESESVGSRPLNAIALVGVWAEVEERGLDEVVNRIYAERERDTGRPVDLGILRRSGLEPT